MDTKYEYSQNLSPHQLMARLKCGPDNTAAYVMQQAVLRIKELEAEITQVKEVDFPQKVESVLRGVQAQRDKYKAALQAIADPIQDMLDACKANGTELNPHMAVQIADNPIWLRDKAKAALAITWEPR